MAGGGQGQERPDAPGGYRFIACYILYPGDCPLGMAKLTNAALIVLASAMLMSVAFIDGRPAVFTDTAFYYSQGEALAGMMGLDPRPDPASAGDPGSSVIANDRLPAPTELDAYVGARSPFYGLLLFSATRAGSLWFLAALQSLAAALTLFIATRAMAPERPRAAYAASILLLTLASPLPFLTTFAMPEVFGGLAIASAIVLIAVPERLGWRSRSWLWLMVAYGSTCHGAYPPVMAAVLLAAAIMLWRTKAGAGAIAARLAGVGVALALAIAAGWTWTAVHTGVTGHRQHSPPFLPARVLAVLADGPGRTFLAQALRRSEPVLSFAASRTTISPTPKASCGAMIRGLGYSPRPMRGPGW